VATDKVAAKKTDQSKVKKVESLKEDKKSAHEKREMFKQHKTTDP